MMKNETALGARFEFKVFAKFFDDRQLVLNRDLRYDDENDHDYGGDGDDGDYPLQGH